LTLWRRIDLSNRDIEYYMSLGYPVVLTPLASDEGGGWFAEIKELPGCGADGETPQEAIESIEESKRLWIRSALKEGRHIPLPESDDQAQYSGRLTLRMPKTLHRRVAELARREGISLNQFLLAAIAFEAGVFERRARRTTDIKATVTRETEGADQGLTDLLFELCNSTGVSEKGK
jgi:antitoxin HicB